MRGLQVVWLIAWVVCVACATASPVRADDGPPPLVLAIYYAWYDWAAWSQPLCDLPATFYVSADESAVERHVIEARDAGIDALVQAWYGPTLGANLTEPNLHTLLAKAASHGLKVAVLVDMTGTYLDAPSEVTEALIAVRDQHAQQAAYLTVGGRPVVFFLGQNALPASVWDAIRSDVDPDHQMIWIAEGASTDVLSTFDGLYLNDLQTADPPGSLDQQWGRAVRRWNQDHGAFRYWVATVIPGYDDSDTASEDDAIVVPRDDGETYRDTWSAARSSDPNWILIRSFNGWTACTYIEPSQAFGDSYLTLTAELVDQLTSTPAATPTSTATPVAPTPTPTEAPAVVTATATLTPTLAPTPYVTPTATLIPTATPFRLATPTLVREVTVAVPTGSTRAAQVPGEPGGIPGDGPVREPTSTPVPRLTVEGGRASRCSLLPFAMTIAVFWGARARRGR